MCGSGKWQAIRLKTVGRLTYSIKFASEVNVQAGPLPSLPHPSAASRSSSAASVGMRDADQIGSTVAVNKFNKLGTCNEPHPGHGHGQAPPRRTSTRRSQTQLSKYSRGNLRDGPPCKSACRPIFLLDLNIDESIFIPSRSFEATSLRHKRNHSAHSSRNDRSNTRPHAEPSGV